MSSLRVFRGQQLLTVVGEALLNVGTVEYKLSCGIPRLQRYFGVPVSARYLKRRIPSLNEQREPCLSLHKHARECMRDDEVLYAELVKTVHSTDHVSVQAMFDFVELADNTEIVCLELGLMLGLLDGLGQMRNELMHSTKLESDGGLIVTTATKPAREISHRELVIFLRKSRHAVHFSSSLLVAGVSLATEGDPLYANLGNGSYNSRFLKKLCGDEISDLGAKWRDHFSKID